MTRSIVIRPEAEKDLAEAFRWYEERRLGVGVRFLLSVEATLATVVRNPEWYPIVHKHVRRALLRRFPYGVFYVVEDDRIVVLAVFHAKRDPKHWQSRA